MINKDSTRDEVLAEVKKDGSAIKYASDLLKNDEEIVLATVKNFNYALEYVHKDQQNNKKVVLAAVKHYGFALEFASDTLKNDEEVVTAAISENGLAFTHASEALRRNPKIISFAIQHNAFTPCLLNQNQIADYDFMLEMVQHDGLALEYAAQSIKNNKTIALAAVKQNERAVLFIGDQLKNEPAFQAAAIVVNYLDRTTPETSAFIRESLAFVIKAQRLDGSIKASIIELWTQVVHLFENSSIKMDTLIQILRTVSPALDSNPSKEQLDVFIKLTQELLNDKSPVLELLGKKMRAIVNREAVQHYNELLAVAPDDIKQDREFVFSLVQQKGNAVLHLAPKDVQPFLQSYLLFKDFIKKDTLNNEAKTHANQLLAQIEAFFLKNKSGQPNLNQLQQVVDKTYAFLSQPTHDASVKDYSAFVQSAIKSKSTGMQLLGKLMMAFAVVVAGASVALGLTGVGTIPAVSVGLAAAGLFAAGATLITKQYIENKELIQHFELKS